MYTETAMATSRKDAQIRIYGLADPLRLHIIKLLLCTPIDPSWIPDVIDFIKQIAHVKLKNGASLKEKDYFDWLYDHDVGGHSFPEYFKYSLNRIFSKDLQKGIKSRFSPNSLDTWNGKLHGEFTTFFQKLAKLLSQIKDYSLSHQDIEKITLWCHELSTYEPSIIEELSSLI
jgi:hypothetical protein